MGGIERVGAWGREIGPWRLGLGLLAVGGAYARIGFAFAGYYHNSQSPVILLDLTVSAATVGSILAVMLPGWVLRGIGRMGLVLSWLTMWLVLAGWSQFPVALPVDRWDFSVFIMPIGAVMWGVEALSTEQMRRWPQG